MEKDLAHVLEKAENLKGAAIEIWNKLCDSTQQGTWFSTLVYLGKKTMQFQIRIFTNCWKFESKFIDFS